jgi:tetratricopeptide (TPR) repeat protein
MATIERLLRDAQASWDDAATLGRIGGELQTRCRFDDAIRVLERAVELDPSQVDAWANISYSHFRSMRGDEGRAVLRRGIEASGSEWLHTVLAGFAPDPEEGERLWAQVAESTAPDVVAARLGNQLWKEGADAKGIFAELKRLQAEHPDNEHVRDALLWALFGVHGRPDLAELSPGEVGVPLAEKMIADDPDEVFGYWYLAQFRRMQKDWDGVLDVTARALERMPDEETTMQIRGQAFREKGDEDRAVTWFQRAIGAKPSFSGVRVDLGRLYEKQGKLELAEEVFRESPKANPGYGLAPISLALFLTRQERLDEAEAVFLDAWPKLPDMFKPSVLQNPEAAPLLERDAVKALIAD